MKKPGQTRVAEFLRVNWKGNAEALEDTIEYYEGRGWELVADGDPGATKRDEHLAIFKRRDCKSKVKNPAPRDDKLGGLAVGDQLAALTGKRKEAKKEAWWY
jgi:hypothetical protein